MDRNGKVLATEGMLEELLGTDTFLKELLLCMSSDMKEFYFESIMRDYDIENIHDMYDEWNGYAPTLMKIS